MEYEVNAATDKILLFSEIWYPDGWKAFVDGTETPIARADYVLRAIRVHGGQTQGGNELYQQFQAVFEHLAYFFHRSVADFGVACFLRQNSVPEAVEC